jgi:hypothetical protein
MNKPKFSAITVSPLSTTTKKTITITVKVEDVQIVFASDLKYARSSNYETLAGEEVGII